jgi:hypothetical protein
MISRTTIVRLINYSIFATVSLALLILFFYKNSAGSRILPSPIIGIAIFVALIIIMQNRLPEGEGTRVFDATLAGLILMALIFLGSVVLLIDIPIFNYVEPILIYGCYIGLLLGLVLGYFAGTSYTKKQLELLDKNNEFRGVGSNKLEAITLSALTVFILFCFLGVYLDSQALGSGLILFAISGTFLFFAARFIQVRAWEYNNGKTVMMTRKRFYVKYKNLPMRL